MPALLIAGTTGSNLPTGMGVGRYVADGGMIVGDACCGWADFAESFRREMEEIFPGRPLRKMLPEEPVFSSYYKLSSFQYKKGDGTEYTDAPSLESIDFGCRSGVIFSPCDLTCGWDGHEHPRGTRVAIDQARQVGANLVTYLFGSFQLGRFLSTTKVYHEAEAPSRDDFVFAQLVHQGDWDPDPSAVHNLLKHARDNSTLEVKFKRRNVRLADPETATYPVLYMTGHHDFHWNEESGRLRALGWRPAAWLVADACCGRMADAVFAASWPGPAEPAGAVVGRPSALPPPQRHSAGGLHAAGPRVTMARSTRRWRASPRRPPGRGLQQFDLGNGWEHSPPLQPRVERRIGPGDGTNILVYAVTH